MRRSLNSDREETLDTLFEGSLKIFQHREGYRFSIDALLVAHFCSPRPKDRIIDLGTGCGIIPLILAYRRQEIEIIGVELQPPLAALARRNVALNGFSRRIQILETDLKDIRSPGNQEAFDLVLSNPPYYEVETGRINPEPEKAAARHEVYAKLEDLLLTASHLLSKKGRLVMIFPASRASDLIRRLGQRRMEPKRLQFVHSRAIDAARFILIEARKEGQPHVEISPPLFLYDDRGNYTPGALEVFR
jgi:tRNA1Val (adenine37-N6)-methyltransferase